MHDNSRTTTIVPARCLPLPPNELATELSCICTNSNNDRIDSNTLSFRRKCDTVIKRFQKLVKKISCPNIEIRGVECISPADRTDLTIMNTGMIWVGANIIIPCFAAGVLGPAVFKLDLYVSFVTIIIFNILGIIPVGAMACFGPASGLRTMVFSRYSWGYYGASIMSITNIFGAFGWTAINSITGAQTLRVVFNNSLPIAASIIIIAIISMIVSFVGYKWIHIYERYSWIPTFIGYCILAGVGAKYFTHSEMVSLNGTISNNISHDHRLELSRILSFGAACFGGAISWCTCAADYNTYFPENTNQFKIFFYTYMGNLLSIIPIQLLGAATYTGTYINQNWAHAYEMNNIGGLLGVSLSSLGNFGKFILVLFALSNIACNIPSIYSLSLSIQVIAPIFERIPRFIYTVIGTVICIVLAIVAEKNFNDLLTSVMGVSSYVSVIFIVIVFEEHLIFRGCSFKNYNFDIWDDRKRLTISLAAILSGLVGVVGTGLGMSQSWFTGPIARAIVGDIGEQGADVGFEVALIFTGVTFPLFRRIELYFIH